MTRVDGRKASAHRISNVREHNEPLTCRSTPHPSTEKHHEETIVPYIASTKTDCCQEDTNGKERCSLSKLSPQRVKNTKIRNALCRKTPTAVRLEEEGTNEIKYRPDFPKTNFGDNSHVWKSYPCP